MRLTKASAARGDAVRLYVKDAWKPSLLPGVRFYYCMFDFGCGSLTMYLFETVADRNYRIRKRANQGYACRGQGTIMWKGKPGERR